MQFTKHTWKESRLIRSLAATSMEPSAELPNRSALEMAVEPCKRPGDYQVSENHISWINYFRFCTHIDERKRGCYAMAVKVTGR